MLKVGSVITGRLKTELFELLSNPFGSLLPTSKPTLTPLQTVRSQVFDKAVGAFTIDLLLGNEGHNRQGKDNQYGK